MVSSLVPLPRDAQTKVRFAVFGGRVRSWGVRCGPVLAGLLLAVVSWVGGAVVRAEVGGGLPLDLATRPQGQDWPAFLGPTADGKSAETGLQTPWPDKGPRLLWQRELGESYGIGSVSRGRYLQFDYADGKARLDCWNAETGQPIWNFSYTSGYTDYYGYNSGPRASPVVDGDRVYLLGVEGMLHCVRLEDGQLIWKVNTQERFQVVQNFFGVGSSPVVFEDLLLVMVGGSPKEDLFLPPNRFDEVKPQGSGIVAFDKHTGEVRYQTLDDLASYATPRIVQQGGRPWAFAFCRGGLGAFDPRNGQVDFRLPWRARILESVNASTPVVWNDRVFISETYGPGAALLAFKPGGFETIWSDEARGRGKAMQTHWNTPIYHEGFLYGSSGRHTGNAELRCVEAETGRVRWSIPDLSRCSLTYLDGHFLCLSETGSLRLVRANPEKYELVSEFTPRLAEQGTDPGNADESARPLLAYPAWAAPIVARGLMYVRGKDRVACYEIIPPRGP